MNHKGEIKQELILLSPLGEEKIKLKKKAGSCGSPRATEKKNRSQESQLQRAVGKSY